MKMSNGELGIANWDVENMALKIARESPKLEDLNGGQLEGIAKMVIARRLAGELNDKANIADIDYEAEKALFLGTAGKTGSEYTRLTYGGALRELEGYAGKNGINILLMNCGQADEFIRSLGGSPNGRRLTAAAVSSFYSFLARRHPAIKNPVRGTRARPAGRAVRDIEIPGDGDMNVLLASLPELERTAVYVMAYRGLRVGALNRLKIWGGRYQAYSKGKEIYGEFSADILNGIRTSGLNHKTPFKGYSTKALSLRIYRATRKLYEAGKIGAAYSAHDFRHYYAVSQYLADKDIYKLSKLLDHSNIAVTETYLRSLKLGI